MTAPIQPFIDTLKSAREAKKLSQQELAGRLGIPQSHLSKIEAGKVNIKLLSFVEMARHLDLEVMLIPRQDISLVKTMIAEKGREENEVEPAYVLDEEKEG